MYLTVGQPARRQRRQRSTLGDGPGLFSSWADHWANIEQIWNATAPTPPPQNTVFIPGSSTLDYLQNAITGQPTSDQLNYNAQQYVQAANNMRQTLLSQGVTPPPELDPATVAAQAASDQQAYAALNGGTAGQSITTYALIALAGILGLMVLTR